MFVSCKAYLSEVSFFPQSETDKADTLSLSKNTSEIALLDCGTRRYQTAAGTGPPYTLYRQNCHDKCTLFLSIFFPQLIILFQLSWAAFGLYLSSNLSISQMTSLSLSGPLFCHYLILTAPHSHSYTEVRD